MYFHDESCFHGHDYKKKIWLDTTVNQQKMPGKSKGRLIHDSEFIGPEGRIRVRGEDREYHPDDLDLDTQKIIYLGSNGDPQQDTKQLLVQVTRTLDIFEKKHSDCITVLVFDQSSTHALHREGALSTWDLTLKDGGIKDRKPKIPMKDTYYPLECTFLEKRGLVQHLQVLNKSRQKVQKGLKKILKERGCLVPNTRAKCKKQYSKALIYPPLVSTKPPCCLAGILLNYKDFWEQESALETIIKERGHKYVFIPKFYYELNSIEMYQGYSKTRYRQVKKTSFDHTKKAEC